MKDSELVAKMDADGDGIVIGSEAEKHVQEMESEEQTQLFNSSEEDD